MNVEKKIVGDISFPTVMDEVLLYHILAQQTIEIDLGGDPAGRYYWVIFSVPCY